MNGFIAQHFGYKAYIVYAILNNTKLHYTTIVQIGNFYYVAERDILSQHYASIIDTKQFFLKIFDNVKYLKIIPFEEFLQILLK